MPEKKPENPAGGGSYTREADGSLKRVGGTDTHNFANGKPAAKKKAATKKEAKS